MKLQILVVDDDKKIQKMLSRRLEQAGYDVSVAENGEQGIQMALLYKPDLVLMDMHMPVMDGYSATRRLREQDYAGKICALTASVMLEDTHKSLAAGCNSILRKPIGADFEERIGLLLQS